MKIKSLLTIGAITVAEAFALVKSPLDGKYKENQCRPYAMALSAELERRHVPCSRIHYEWWDSGEHALHVIVFFRTNDGEEWLADNENAKPYRVSGPLTNGNALHWITGFWSPFGGMASDCKVVYISAER